MPKTSLAFVQILSAPWKNRDGNLTYTLFGLTKEGAVYRNSTNGWKAENMQPVGGREEHPFASAPRSVHGVDDDVPF